MASVGIGEATREAIRDGGGVVSLLAELFCRLKVEAAALASAAVHFLDEAPSQV